MSQSTNPRLSAESAADRVRTTRDENRSAETAADRVRTTRDEVFALLTEAGGLGDANITTWFQARQQPLVRLVNDR